MAKFSKTLSADGSVEVARATISGRGLFVPYFGTAVVQGTFGSGTLTWQVSFDGGTTKIGLLDTAGSAMTSTTNEMGNFQLGYGSLADGSDAPIIYATLAGSTNPALIVSVFDID